jgi:GNAT superfamily N-acetyltransferase
VLERQATIRVRSATRSDAEQLAAVSAEAWRAAYGDILPPRILDRATARDELAARFRAALATEATMLVATIDDRVAGYIGCGPSRDNGEAEGTAEIYAIYVEPDHWRAGLGTRLIGAALGQLATSGFDEVMLWTFAENAPARRFYEVMGFEHDGGVRRSGRSGWAPEVRYRRSLGLRRPAAPPAGQ